MKLIKPKDDVEEEDEVDEVDELPTMTCPQCGAEVPDHDGFGMLAHTRPAYPDGCGYCSHPSRDATPDGSMRCGICGAHTEIR